MNFPKRDKTHLCDRVIKPRQPTYSMKKLTTLENLIAIEQFAYAMFRGIPRRSTPGGRPQTAWDHTARIANRFLGDNDLMAVALLHDVVEDTSAKMATVGALKLPMPVYTAVLAITHKDGESYEHYIDRVAKHDYARRVKLVDIGDNLSDNPTPFAIKKYSEALLKLTRTKIPSHIR